MNGPRGTEERNVRVFVSSTFRDMAAERDVLVGSVFPRLRAICARRGVAFSEIDLRWGLTDEEVAEGKVLPTCLDEIRRCKPYFIGLLGERYGWVPHEIPADLLSREGWLRPHAGVTSVTELEILYGVLNDPEMQIHSAFYLRSPEYIGSERFLRDTEDRPEDRPLFREHPTAEEVDRLGTEEAEQRAQARRRKLDELKDRLRSRSDTREFADPDQLGELVFEDLKAVIDAKFPDEAPVDPLAAESKLHDFFALSRSKVYARRASYFEVLDDFAEEDSGGALSVLGDSGSGKSALLATWGLGYRSRHPDELVLMHFIGSSQKSTELGPMLNRLNHELGLYLRTLRDEPDDADESADAADQARLLKERLRAAGSQGKVVLVLDALNQLAEADEAQDLGWLPRTLPAGVRLVVSTLRGPAYEELERRGWLAEKLKVRPLERSEREELIDLYLGRELAKNLTSRQKDSIINLPQAESPLYIRILLDELRVWGDHATLDSRLSRLTEASSIAELLQLILARYESTFEDHRPGLVGDAMSLIWASRQGIGEGELLEIMGGETGRLPAAYWSPLHIAASEMLIERGGLLDFAHVYFESAVERRYLADPDARSDTRRRLADHFRTEEAPTPRALEELPTQLVALGSWSELAQLLARPSWFIPLAEQGQFEIRSLWSKIHANSEFRSAEVYAEIGAAEQAGADPAFMLGAAELLIAHGARHVAQRVLERYVSAGGTDDRDALRLLSWIHMYRGELDRALELMERWEQVCRDLGDRQDLAMALGNQAVIHRDRGDLDRAMELLTEEEGICREYDYAAGLQASIGSQATVHREWGELERAMELHLEQERICRELDHPQLPVAIGNQAVIHRDRGELEESLDLLREEEALCRELDNPGDLQVSLGNQALVHRDRGELDRALELHREEERICRELENHAARQSSLGNQALVHRDRGELDRALELHREEERICRELELPAGLATSLGNQATIWLERGELDRALELHREEERICRELDSPAALQASLGNQALIQRELGDPEQALELLGEKERICRELELPASLQVALGGQALIHGERDEPERALELHREEERICRELVLPADLATSLGNQAAIHADRGDLRRARDLLAEQERLFLELDRRSELRRTLASLAVLAHARSEMDDAAELHRRLERLCEELGDDDGKATAIANQAMILLHNGDPGGGRERLAEAHDVARAAGLEKLAVEIEKLSIASAGA